MNFLERSLTTRSRTTRSRVNDTRPVDPSGVAEETMDPRRRPPARRPNTSAGVETGLRSSSKGWSKAREGGVQSPTCSEDLHMAGKVVEITDGLDTFRFPTPSPRMPPRSATFQHSPSPLHYESPRIGVAIGSPSHAPPSWGRSFTADNITTLAQQRPPSRAPPQPPQEMKDARATGEQRRKKASWKPFSALFRKASKHLPAQSLRREQHDSGVEKDRSLRCSPDLLQPDTTSGLTSPDSRSPRRVLRRHSRAPSWSRNNHRPDFREQDERTSHLPGKLIRGLSTPSPRIKPLRESVDIFDRSYTRPAQENVNIEDVQGATPRTPKLLLEFPKPEFDRYSVMFEKLLTDDPRPSLLERRQSRLQRKKSGQGELEDGLGVMVEAFPAVPQRSLTSPHLTSRLSIRVDSNMSAQFPLTGGLPSADRRPQPLLQRSNTAPPGATSPMRAIFIPERKATLESSPESPHSALYSENSLPPTPTSATTYTDTDSVRRVLDQNEPAWDMVTSQPVSVLSPTSEKKELYPRVKSPEDLERQIVQVSVARQVSVSRARSRVSKAMETKQPLRPRVVELTKNRKSTVGVLESAGEDEVEPMPQKAEVVETESAA